MRPRQDNPPPVRCVLLANIETQNDRVPAQVCEPTTNTVHLIQFQEAADATGGDTWQINGGNALAVNASADDVAAELVSLGNSADDFQVGYAHGGGIWTIEWFGSAPGLSVTALFDVSLEVLTGKNAFSITRPGTNNRGRIMVHAVRLREGNGPMLAGSICLANWLGKNGYGVQSECRDAGAVANAGEEPDPPDPGGGDPGEGGQV